MPYTASVLEPRVPPEVELAHQRSLQLRPGERLEVSYAPGGPEFRIVPTVVPTKTAMTPAPARPLAGAGGSRATARARGEIAYVEISPDDVPYRLRAEVEAELPRLARALGVRGARLGWFRRAVPGEKPDFTSKPVLGVSWPGAGVVALSKDLTPRQGVEVLAHELAHLRGDFDEGDCRRAEALPWMTQGRLS